MIPPSVDVSTPNIDSDFINSVNSTVDNGTVNCTWPRWNPACANDSILCDCNARDFDFVFIGIFQISRAACLLLGPAYALIVFPDFINLRRIQYVLILPLPLVYPVLHRYLPENEIVETVFFISVPSILQGALFFYMFLMCLHTSNFVTKIFKPSYAFDEFGNFYFTDTGGSINKMALLLVGVVGFLQILFETVPDLDGHLKFVTLLGRLQDPLFYPNPFMFIPVALVIHFTVIAVFAVDHFRKEVNPDIPPNLNKQIYVAHSITALTWYFGAYVTLFNLWGLWRIFNILTVVEPFLFWAWPLRFMVFDWKHA